MNPSYEIAYDETYASLTKWLSDRGIRRIFLVAGNSAEHLAIGRYLRSREAAGELTIIKFSDYQPNPEIASASAGIRLLKENPCDLLLAIGGGSPMDVAKCIKLYYHADPDKELTAQKGTAADLPFLAIPTTAGSGSEATRFAVVYRDRKKLSITDEKALPDAFLLDPGTLAGLPTYQKKATLLDALCHAVEAYWSVNATRESRGYSEEAIRLIMAQASAYVGEDETARAPMMKAAHLAGQAINIARTTAGHAMCYKLTTGYGLAHGHAASLCVEALWTWMAEVAADNPGQTELTETLRNLSVILTGSESATPADGAAAFRQLVYETLAMERPKIRSTAPEEIRGELDALAEYVNPERLKNHPVKPDQETLNRLYRGIMGLE